MTERGKGAMSISEEIRALAAERKAVILAHNYTRGEVQEIGRASCREGVYSGV